MKKYIMMMIALWIVSIIVVFLYNPKSGAGYMLEINRLHEQTIHAVMNVQTIRPVESDSIESMEIVNISQLTPEQKRLFFAGTDSNRFVILPTPQTDIFIRYNIKSQKQNRLFMLLLLSLMPLTALFALIKIQIDVLKPLRSMSEIPEQLAKGHFQANALQYKGKMFHRFLWGLDMLRTKLDEQKNTNLGLEKERKTLVASLSHDIKTPLSSIKMYSTAIKDGVYGTQEEIQEALNIIIEKTIKIERLTDELLMSSVHAIEEIIVDTAEHYLSELIMAIDSTIHNRISLLKMEYHIESLQNDFIVKADMDRLIEVCDNIIENAVKYGDLGGLFVRFENEEQCILISFENTGSHISETEIKHIFTGFYRGSNVGNVQGHGLGLYIAGKIMRAMGGDIYAQNTDTGVKIVLVIKHAV